MRNRSRSALLAAIFNEDWAGPNPVLGVPIAFEKEMLHYVSLFPAWGTVLWGFVLRMKLFILSFWPTAVI